MDDVRRLGRAHPCGKLLTVRSGALVWFSMQPRVVDQLGLSSLLVERQLSRQHAGADGA